MSLSLSWCHTFLQGTTMKWMIFISLLLLTLNLLVIFCSGQNYARKVLKRRRTSVVKNDNRQTESVEENSNRRNARCKSCGPFFLILFSSTFLILSVLSLFTIVRFENDACPTTSGNNGTCYTA